MAAGIAAAAVCTTTAACSFGKPGEGGSTPRPVTPSAGVDRPAGTARPNILLITADDASVQDMRHMPYTQRLLARRGVTFTDALAPTPICVPARASLLTGQYAHNHHALTISGAGGGYRAFAREGGNRDTLPQWLRAAGYDTLFVGKYLNGYADDYRPTVEPGWDDWRAAMGGSTYSFVHTVMDDNGRAHRTSEYSTDLFTDDVVDMLGRERRRHTPWYLWVNYVGPHHGGPHEPDDPRGLKTTTPAARHRNEFDHLPLPTSPALWAGNGPGQRTAQPSIGPRMRAAIREGHQQRVEALQSVDEGVRDAIGELRRTHQLDKTVVIFTSDNGFVTGEHNRYGKLMEFDHILRIPVIAAGPGIPRGRKVSSVVTNPDLAVTIAAMAHARPTRDVDGVDFRPVLREGHRERVVPIEAYPPHGGRTPMYTGVRLGQWTYIRSRGGHEELYDRSVDPYERASLAVDRRYKRVLRALRALNETYRDCAGDTCPQTYLTRSEASELLGASR
jgi:arylsulfatase A-like enzyme